MQTFTEFILKKIKAVRELARRGVEGEQESAKARLKAMYEKYGIADDTELDNLKAGAPIKTTVVSESKKEKNGERPPLVYAAPNLIPKEKFIVTPTAYQVDKHQLKGINLMLTQFLIRGGKGFLLADGTGTGKTRQILVTAHEFKKRTGKNVLIVTENRTIIAGSFTADAQALGMRLSQFELGTYADIRGGKIGKKNYGLVIFDEAHNLKNPHSSQTKKSNSIKTDHKVFATATPLDTIDGAAYFVQEVTNMSEVDIYNFLGFRLEYREDEQGNTIRSVTLNKGVTHRMVCAKLVDLRNEIIAQGAMLRREYPFYGTIETMNLPLNSEALKEEKKIDYYWLERIATHQGSALSNAGQRSGELSRWNEIQKVGTIIEKSRQKVNEGKAVVVIAEGINDTRVKGLGSFESGFIGVFERTSKLKVASIYGSNDKPFEVQAFQTGMRNVALATPKSGGTGINLDDTKGDRPRVLYMVTPNYSGNLLQQILGRVSRRNTKSPSVATFVYTNSLSDKRRQEIVKAKLDVLRAIQNGVLSEHDADDLGEGEFDTQSEKIQLLLEIAANDNSHIVDLEVNTGTGKITIKVNGEMTEKTFKIFQEYFPKMDKGKTYHNRLEVDITPESIEWAQRLSESVAPTADFTKRTKTATTHTYTHYTGKPTNTVNATLFGNENNTPPQQPEAKNTSKPTPKATTQTKNTPQPKAKKANNSWFQSELF